jgi:ABC-type branched-subunit amino acid transport system permease subunit
VAGDPAGVPAGGDRRGVLLGTPVLKLRGDYLAIVTLGFGEIIRIFLNNLDHPVNITNGPKGINQIDSVKIFGWTWASAWSCSASTSTRSRCTTTCSWRWW